MIRKLSVILLFVPLFVALAQEGAPPYSQVRALPPEHYARERTYHVVHYRLSLSIAMRARTCAGDVSLTIVPLREGLSAVLLDAAPMEIREVRKDGVPLSFTHEGDSLLIRLDRPYGFRDTLHLTVSYSVTSPAKGLYFIESDSTPPARDWCVWTQGEAEDNHYWFPCYDFPNDRATSEMICTVDEGCTAISNGRLLDVKKDRKAHTATYHWYESKPYVSYLISLIVGTYVDVKDAAGKLPLSYYVFPRDKDLAMLSFGKTPAMIRYFEDRTGFEYPWEKYAQTVVSEFMYGGEENVSATTLTSSAIHDARAHLDYNSDGLVAHELAHQWWGDMVSFRDWSHAWLSEGFATYFEVLFTEHDRGRDAAAAEIYDNQRYVASTDNGDARRPTVSGRFYNPMDVFDVRIYGKGACILHMMRFVLGEEAFWKGIREYIRRHAFRCIETNDFRLAMEDATGRDLHWFFDEWVYRPGYPEFSVRSAWDAGKGLLRVIVEQTQKTDSLTGIFRMPVEIEVFSGAHSVTYRAELSRSADTLEFPAAAAPEAVIFDKGSRILKKVTYEKPPGEWLYQLAHAEEGVDRLDALRQLRSVEDSAGLAPALMKAAALDPFVQVRREAVWKIGTLHGDDVTEALVKAAGDPEASVRSAAVAGLGNLKSAGVIGVLKAAFEGDSSYGVVTSALSSLWAADSAGRKEYIRQALAMGSYAEVIRASALRLLASSGDAEALPTLLAYTRPGVYRNLRLEAIGLLVTRWKEDTTVLKHIATLLEDPSPRVRRSSLAALGNAGNVLAIPPLERALEKATDPAFRKAIEETLAQLRQKNK